ncbi:hypothetical protein KFE25_012652 [Diacronema lutheri]|uniref:Uncharacterized protein n=1 Tax=Diacronema lutheri TaxID=2081491 RepID=A0A8J5X4B5_DIALT|nr:hypothetical protein KFE25_012652 [Diacronema lutheri]
MDTVANRLASAPLVQTTPRTARLADDGHFALSSSSPRSPVVPSPPSKRRPSHCAPRPPGRVLGEGAAQAERRRADAELSHGVLPAGAASRFARINRASLDNVPAPEHALADERADRRAYGQGDGSARAPRAPRPLRWSAPTSAQSSAGAAGRVAPAPRSTVELARDWPIDMGRCVPDDAVRPNACAHGVAERGSPAGASSTCGCGCGCSSGSGSACGPGHGSGRRGGRRPHRASSLELEETTARGLADLAAALSPERSGRALHAAADGRARRSVCAPRVSTLSAAGGARCVPPSVDAGDAEAATPAAGTSEAAALGAAGALAMPPADRASGEGERVLRPPRWPTVAAVRRDACVQPTPRTAAAAVAASCAPPVARGAALDGSDGGDGGSGGDGGVRPRPLFSFTLRHAAAMLPRCGTNGAHASSSGARTSGGPPSSPQPPPPAAAPPPRPPFELAPHVFVDIRTFAALRRAQRAPVAQAISGVRTAAHPTTKAWAMSIAAEMVNGGGHGGGGAHSHAVGGAASLDHTLPPPGPP